MAPRKKPQDVLHANGALQTVFDANPTRKCKGGGRSQAANDVALADVDGPSQTNSDADATPKRRRGRKAQEARAAAIATPHHATSQLQSPPAPPFVDQPISDEGDNPFLEPSPSHHPPSPLMPEHVLNQPAQLARLHVVAIPASQTPRAGRHSPNRASLEVAHARQKSRKAANDVRAFFREEKGQRYCKFCEQEHAASSNKEPVDSYRQSSATTTLRRHLYSKHLDQWVSACKKMGIRISASEPGIRKALEDFNRRHETEPTDGPVPTYRAYSPEAFVDAIVEWIVADDQSLNVIENLHLRSIFLMLRQELRDKDIPHRTAIRNCVMEVWQKHIKDLEKDMKKALGKISFMADCWTDTNLTPFMAITAHWMDYCVKNTSNGPRYIISLCSELVAFHRVPGRHTGEHLATVFISILDRYKIKKIGWITLDNASNNDTMISSLESQLTARGIEFSCEERRVRCFPHIVNIAVQAVLSSITNMNYAQDDAEYFDPTWSGTCDVIASLRTLINKIRASSLCRQRFTKIQEDLHLNPILQLIRDVSTRWSSTHLMIVRALELRRAIDIFISENADMANHKLSNRDWDNIRAYSKILALPHAFQQKLSSEKTPTLCEALPSFQRMIAVWEQYQREMPAYVPVIEAGLEKLREYYDLVVDIPAYQLAILLNPLKKLNWFVENMPDKVEHVREMFLEHLDPYQPSSNPRTPRPQRTAARSMNNEDEWADEILGTYAFANHGQNRSLQAEIDAYFLDTVPTSFTNMMTFWQENQLRYPTIFMLAMDILAIQGSAVPCERVFSSGKETMAPRRNRIKHDLMEALQMLKFSFKHVAELNFTAGLSRQSELRELEELDVFDSAVPEELSSFRRILMSSLDENDPFLSPEGSESGSDTSCVSSN